MIRIQSHIALIAIFLAVALSTGFAKTVYMKQAGNDAAAGTSWATAWRTIAKMNTSTASGDTVYFGTGIYADALMTLYSGTANDWTVYACSSWATAGETPVTGHPASIRGGKTIIGGWTRVGTSNAWVTTYTPTLPYAPMYQGRENILWRRPDSASVNSPGECWSGNGRCVVWLYNNANPNSYEIGVAERKVAYLNNGTSFSSQLEYVKFIGLAFENSYNRTFSDEDSDPKSDNLQWIHCYFNNVVGDGGANNAFIMLMSRGNGTDVNDFISVRACSLGNVWSYYGAAATYDQSYSGNNAERIGLYSLRYSVIDSNVFFGKGGHSSMFFKCSHGDANPFTEYDTVRFNTFNTEDNVTGSSLIFYGKVREVAIYGNTFKGANNGIYCYYGGYSWTGSPGQLKIFNNTFIGGVNSWYLQYDTESQASAGHVFRNTEMKYNVFYHTFDASVVQSIDQISYWTAGGIDSNLYYSSGSIALQSPYNTTQSQSWWQNTGGMDQHSSFGVNPGLANITGGDFSRLSSATEMNRNYGGKTWTRFGAWQPSGGPCTPPPPTAIPTLLLPASAATGLTQPIIFDWSDVITATNYRIQIDDNSDFSSITIDQQPTLSTYTTSGLTAGTAYYWRARGQNACGPGPWSSVRTLSTCTVAAIPTFVLPANGATGLSQPLVLDWSDIASVINYQVQVDNNSDFSSPAVDQAALVASTFSASGLTAAVVYYWRVRASNLCGWSNWSAARSFTIGSCTAPIAPTLALPANGATGLALPITLDWNDVATATNYQVQVDDSSGFASPAIDQQMVASTYAASGLAAGVTFYWRARAQSSCGWGAWSAARSFVTACTLPGLPTLVTPANSATNVSQPIAIDWSDVASATGYQVQIDNNSDFSSPAIDQLTTPSTYSASGLTGGAQFYWRARARNACGSGTWSGNFTFTTNLADGTPPVISGVTVSDINANSAFITWTTNEVSTSQVNYGTTTSYGSSTALNSSNVTAHGQVVVGLAPQTLYHFRVRSRDAAGNEAVSGDFTFTTSEGMSNLDNGIVPVVESTYPGYSITEITDGDVNPFGGTASTWASNESTTLPHWVEINFGASRVVKRAVIYWAWNPTQLTWMNSQQFMIQAWNGSSYTDIITVNSSQPDSCSFINFTPTSTTRIRYYQPANMGPATYARFLWISEIDLFGQSNTAPSVPSLSSPVNGVAVSSTTPVLTINNSIDPESNPLVYDFQVSSNSGFTTVVAQGLSVASGIGSTTSWTVNTVLSTGITYYWRARAYDASLYSSYAASQTFTVGVNTAPTVPTLSSPAAGVTVTTLTPVLVLNNSTDAQGNPITYNFQVSTSSAFGTIAAQATGVAQGAGGTTSWTVNPNLSGGITYYWRARSYDGALYSSFSTSRTFITNSNTAPGAPTPQSPINNVRVLDMTPDLVVVNAVDVNGNSLTYQFELYNSLGTILLAQSPMVNSGPSTTAWTVTATLAYRSSYTWRARAYDGQAWSVWTATQLFRTNRAPSIPQLAGTLGDGTSSTLSKMLGAMASVDPDGDQLSYQFEVYDGSDTTLLLSSGMVSEDSLIDLNVASDDLPIGEPYAMRVRAFDGEDSSDWSVLSRFVAAAPGIIGDMDASGAIDIRDAIYMLNYIFSGGPSPVTSGDANCDDMTNVSDAVTLIDYLFAGGKEPRANCDQ